SRRERGSSSSSDSSGSARLRAGGGAAPFTSAVKVQPHVGHFTVFPNSSSGTRSLRPHSVQLTISGMVVLPHLSQRAQGELLPTCPVLKGGGRIPGVGSCRIKGHSVGAGSVSDGRSVAYASGSYKTSRARALEVRAAAGRTDHEHVEAATQQLQRQLDRPNDAQDTAHVGQALALGVHAARADLLHVGVGHAPGNGPEDTTEYYAEDAKSQDGSPAVRRPIAKLIVPIVPPATPRPAVVIIILIIVPAARAPVVVVIVIIAAARAPVIVIIVAPP